MKIKIEHLYITGDSLNLCYGLPICYINICNYAKGHDVELTNLVDKYYSYKTNLIFGIDFKDSVSTINDSLFREYGINSLEDYECNSNVDWNYYYHLRKDIWSSLAFLNCKLSINSDTIPFPLYPS